MTSGATFSYRVALSCAIDACRLLEHESTSAAGDYRACAYHCKQALRLEQLDVDPQCSVPAQHQPLDGSRWERLHHYLAALLSLARALRESCAIDSAFDAANGAFDRRITEVRRGG